MADSFPLPTFQSDEEAAQYAANLEVVLKSERRRSRNLDIDYNAFKNVPVVKSDGGNRSLKSRLMSILPPELMPTNVGAIDSVAWQYTFSLDFDFGDDPTFSPLLTQEQQFQVPQEAAFLLLSVARSSAEYSTAGSLGPWQIDYIKDLQSSRTFNASPIVFQSFGQNSNPTILSTPMLFYPNAFVSARMSSFVPNAEAYQVQGSSKHQLSFFGYRVRMGDELKMLSTIFG